MSLVKKKKKKNIYQEAKKFFNLRVKIYKKLIFETENLKPEETIAERVKLKNKGLKKKKK